MFFRKKRDKKGQLSFWPRLDAFSFEIQKETSHGILMVFLILLVTVVTFSLFDYAGHFGHNLKLLLSYLFGANSWFLPIVIALLTVRLASEEEKKFDSANWIGLFLFMLSISSFFYFLLPSSSGVIAKTIVEKLFPLVGIWVVAILVTSIVIVSLLLLFDLSLNKLFGKRSFAYQFFSTVLEIVFYPIIHLKYQQPQLAARKAKEEGGREGGVYSLERDICIGGKI